MKILVVYYTQSGQLKQIIDQVLSPLKNTQNITIDYEQIKPVEEFPFPWGKKFFDNFPESVKLVPCILKPFSFDKNIEYDLIILACQTWYLSPSIPINSFLQSTEAAKLLAEKKVITLHGIRNMWTCSQEIIKKKLKDLGARLVGNIVLGDRADNYFSVITIIRWLVHGKKEGNWLFHGAGVSTKDIEHSKVFGEIIKDALLNNSFEDLQKKLVSAGAVRVKFNLMMIEKNAKKIFNKFAAFAIKKGGPTNPKRATRIKLFKWYLLFVIFVISPIASLIFILLRIIIYPVATKKIDYYKGIELV